MAAGEGAMEGTRSALIVACHQYNDPGLRQLRAPASDAQALAGVLQDPSIGGFEVRTLLNQPAHEVSLAVEEFFADRRTDDLLLVHFSCHGVKDEDGELYFAMANTLLQRLGATAVSAEFVSRRMTRSRSRRVVLLLDCCYAGAFERGMTARAGAGVGIESQFGGRGRAVITASSAMEYAFEGDELADASELAPSVFTSALVEGLETGDADRDQDGLVALDEMYDYIYDKVRAATPHQTPGKWTFGVQGELVIARRSRPVTMPAPLPRELQEALGSPFAAVRTASVQELARLLHGTHAGLALAARLAMKQLTEDDSRTVAAAATAALTTPQQPAPPQLQLSATMVDFGRLPRHSQPAERRIRLGNTGGGTLNARGATQASWLRLRQEDNELIVAIDTEAAGERAGTIIVDSNGGSASIAVQAHIDPTRQRAPKTATAARPEAEPQTAEGAQPAEQRDAANLAPEPAGLAVEATAAMASTPSLAVADHGAAFRTREDRRLMVAGGLAVAGAVMTAAAVIPSYVPGYRLLSDSSDRWASFITAALAISAGICTYVPRTRRLIAPGLMIGGLATAPINIMYAIIIAARGTSGQPGAGLWLDFAASVILVLALCLTGFSLARTGDVRLPRRLPQGWLPWLVALLGVAGAAALFIQAIGEHAVPGRNGLGFIPGDDLAPLIWVTIMALLIPAAAAVTLPRQFGLALLAAWIGSGVAIVALFTGFAGSIFGCTLLAFLAVIIPFARAAPPSQDQRIA